MESTLMPISGQSQCLGVGVTACLKSLLKNHEADVGWTFKNHLVIENKK